MNRTIRPQFETLQQQKETVLAGLADWPGEQLQFRPAAASWSALDILDHLVKVEKAWLDAAERSLPNGHSVTSQDWLRGWLVWCVLRSPLRLKVPASAVQVWPEESVPYEVISSQWQGTRNQMAERLSGLSAAQLGRGLFQHPVSGWMTPLQSIRFLSAHLQHHSYQFKRLKHSVRPLRQEG